MSRPLELAENPPVWLADLGPVPRRVDRHRDWCDLAAEIHAYRHTYNIPDSEPLLVPKEHQKNAIAQDLRARATSLHKHSSLTTKPPLTIQELAVDRLEAELAAPETPSTAGEYAIAELRRRRTENKLPDATPFREQDEQSAVIPPAWHRSNDESESQSIQEQLTSLKETQNWTARKQRRDDPSHHSEPDGPRLG